MRLTYVSARVCISTCRQGKLPGMCIYIYVYICDCLQPVSLSRSASLSIPCACVQGITRSPKLGPSCWQHFLSHWLIHEHLQSDKHWRAKELCSRARLLTKAKVGHEREAKYRWCVYVLWYVRKYG